MRFQTWSAAKQISVVLLATVVICGAGGHLPGWWGSLGANAIALWFVLSAFSLASRDPRGLPHFGLHFAGLADNTPLSQTPFGSVILAALRQIAFAFVVAIVLFPPFALGFYLWNAPTQPFHWTWPEDLWNESLNQLVGIALPEEAFFRAYLQTRLQDVSTYKRRWLGAWIYPKAWIGQAIVFALVHVLVTPHPSRLAVFFPALVFGWMRQKSGGIGAGIVFHALCNLYAQVLYLSWLTPM